MRMFTLIGDYRPRELVMPYDRLPQYLFHNNVEADAAELRAIHVTMLYGQWCFIICIKLQHSATFATPEYSAWFYM